MSSALEIARFALSRGDGETAILILEDVTRRCPGAASAHFGLAMTLRRDGDLLGARAAFRRVAELEPGRADVHHWLATVTAAMGDVQQALAHIRDAAELDPNDASIRNDLGAMLLSLRMYDEAKLAFERAAELDPDWSVPVHNLGITATRIGDRERARALMLHAAEKDGVAPLTQLSLGMDLLNEGDFAEGWRRYEWRGGNAGKPQERADLRVPVWDGSPLAGRTLLLWHEQGLGDVLQFVRFASLIPKDGGRVVVYTQKPIARVIATCEGVDAVAVDGDTLGIDLQFPLLSLPFLLGAVPTPGPPYLRAPAECPDAGAAIVPGEALNVGIVWASGRMYPLHAVRDCPLELFAGLADIPGVKLFSLQFGEAVPELERSPAPIVDLSPVLGDFATTAAFVKRLDLVITVDTSLAHLAGAIGAPVWTLICASPDWRWRSAGDDTPWYPTMRLYRQERLGDWKPAMERIARDLAKLTAGRFPSWTPPAKRAVPARTQKPAPRTFIKQYGEARTGTNYLRAMILANHPDTEVLIHILGDKHAPPVPFDELRREAAQRENPAWSFVGSATYGRPGALMKPGNADQTREICRIAPPLVDAFDRGELRYLVSIKDPYAWAVSIARFRQWMFGNAPVPLEFADALTIACRRFNRVYASWFGLAEKHADRTLIVRHEDAVHDADAVMRAIEAKFGLTRETELHRITGEVAPTHVDGQGTTIRAHAFDRGYTTDRLYLEQLPPPLRDVVTKTIDWSALAPLGYTPLED